MYIGFDFYMQKRSENNDFFVLLLLTNKKWQLLPRIFYIHFIPVHLFDLQLSQRQSWPMVIFSNLCLQIQQSMCANTTVVQLSNVRDNPIHWEPLATKIPFWS